MSGPPRAAQKGIRTRGRPYYMESLQYHFIYISTYDYTLYKHMLYIAAEL